VDEDSKGQRRANQLEHGVVEAEEENTLVVAPVEEAERPG